MAKSTQLRPQDAPRSSNDSFAGSKAQDATCFTFGQRSTPILTENRFHRTSNQRIVCQPINLHPVLKERKQRENVNVTRAKVSYLLLLNSLVADLALHVLCIT